MGTTGELRDGVWFRCPGCTGAAAAGFAADGEPMLMHRPPTCALFDSVATADEGAEFLRRAREGN